MEFFRRYFDVYSTDTLELAPTSYVTRRTFITSAFDCHRFREQLIDIIKCNNIDVVIPASHYSIKALDELREDVKRCGALPLLSNSEALAICCDKYKTALFLESNGMQIPKVYDPSELHGAKMDFPLFIKPRDGAGAKNSFKVENEKELAFFLDYVPNPLVQKYVTGQEYTIDVFSDLSSNVVCAVPRKRLEVRDGEMTKGVTEKNRTLITYASEVARKLGTIGPICVQCFEVDGGYNFTEINPRFGGGITLSIAAGADVPLYLHAAISGAPLRYDESWIDGLYVSRAYKDFYRGRQSLGT